MGELVTPAEMARTLGISPKTLRAWLRSERDAGHPLAAGHEHYGRWEFTRAQADALIAEYRLARGHANRRPPAAAEPSRHLRATTPLPVPNADAPSATTPRGDLPPPPDSFTRPALATAGFEGFKTWSHLRNGAYQEIPSTPGVYVVVRTTAAAPAWTHPGTGGAFKGRDPSVSADRLAAEWVPGARVVYIGKAAARKSGGLNDGLRKRLSEYGRFGAGEPIGHWGGRLIWQLADANKLLVAWHAIAWDETARAYEQRLMARFAEIHGGRRPFANLTG